MEEQDDDEFVMGKYRHNNLNKTWASVAGFETWAAIEPKWAAKVGKFRARFEAEIEVISEAASLETRRMIEKNFVGFSDHFGDSAAKVMAECSHSMVDVAKARALYQAAVIFNIVATKWTARAASAFHLVEENAAISIAESEALWAYTNAKNRLRVTEMKVEYNLNAATRVQFKALDNPDAKQEFWLREIAEARTAVAEAEANWIKAKKKKEKS